MSRISIRGGFDKARMIVSSLRQVGLSYTLGIRSMAEKGRRNREERPMQRHDVDRRLFLGASAVTLLGAAGAARAQAPQAAKASDTAGAKPTARVVDFIAGFDPKDAPALAVERGRTAFIDTVGVMLAGSRSEPAGIVLELVRAEGAKPEVSIVGQSLRASPQLAALANGVASHALDSTSPTCKANWSRRSFRRCCRSPRAPARRRRRRSRRSSSASRWRRG
jgi:hypothetical protein